MNDTETLYLECACSSPRHVARIQCDASEQDGIDVSFFLSPYPHSFWKRLVTAFKYVFGSTISHCDSPFDNFIMKDADVEHLRFVLERHQMMREQVRADAVMLPPPPPIRVITE